MTDTSREAQIVKPLDLSNILRHAFLSGFVAAKNLPAHEPYNGVAHWADYDPDCAEYKRILSALNPDFLTRAETAEARLAEAVEGLSDLRKSAALLQQNAEGCAVNHYGEDFEVHGLPGWLADTRASIDRATTTLAKIKGETDDRS